MENKVKIYSLSTCSHCKSTKKLLDECSVQYDFTDVDTLQGEERTAILDDVRKLTVSSQAFWKTRSATVTCAARAGCLQETGPRIRTSFVRVCTGFRTSRNLGAATALFMFPGSGTRENFPTSMSRSDGLRKKCSPRLSRVSRIEAGAHRLGGRFFQV